MSMNPTYKWKEGNQLMGEYKKIIKIFLAKEDYTKQAPIRLPHDQNFGCHIDETVNILCMFTVIPL